MHGELFIYMLKAISVRIYLGTYAFHIMTDNSVNNQYNMNLVISRECDRGRRCFVISARYHQGKEAEHETSPLD